MLKIPQKLQLDLSPQGLHKCPGSFATAPQVLQVYDMIPLLLYDIPEPDCLKFDVQE
jgi:hypothetical protein